MKMEMPAREVLMKKSPSTLEGRHKKCGCFENKRLLIDHILGMQRKQVKVRSVSKTAVGLVFVKST